MRGDYKTTGGKLVSVNFDVEAGHLRNVQVSGDFFLYPEEALGDIRAALEGLPEATGQVEIVDKIRGALAPDVSMVGFSPEAVAIAVERGLGRDHQ
ncbi:MAG: biotin--protein ligase [Thermomicrobiales bacterium]